MGDLKGRRVLLATVKGSLSLTAIDVATGERVAVASVADTDAEKPHEFAISGDGREAWVTLYGSADYGPNKPGNRIAIVDLQTFTCSGHVDLGLYRGPHSIIAGRDGGFWVTVEENACLVRIDPVRREIDRTIWTHVPAHWVMPTHDGGTFYCAHKEYPFLSEIDAASGDLKARIALPVGSQAMALSPDGGRLYVGDFFRPLLHIVDPARRALVQTVPLQAVPGWPYAMPDGRFVVVTTYDEPADRGYVEILDAADPTKRRVVAAPGEPFHSHVSDDTDRIHVACGDGSIVTISLERAEQVGAPVPTGGVMPEMIRPVTLPG